MTTPVGVPKHVELGYLASAIGAMLWGLGPVLIKNLEIGGVAMNAYRWAVIAVLVIVFDAVRGDPLPRSAIRSTWIPGCLIGLNVSLFFSAARETSVANATILNSLHPIIVALIATRVLGNRIGARSALWGAIALAATIVVILGEPVAGINSAFGNVLAVGSAITFAGVYLTSQRARQELSTTHYLAATSIWTAAVATVLALIVGQDLSFPVATDWLGLLALVVVPGFMGTGLVWWSVGRIPVWISSSLALLAPVSGAVAAWVVLDEPLTTLQVAAMLVAVAGLVGLIHDRPTPATG